MSKLIELTQGKVAIVDDADFEWLSQIKWCANETTPGKFYAVYREYDAFLKRSFHRYMHKMLMPGVRRVDHKNRNTLDNRRENLRPALGSQNHQNQAKRSQRVQPTSKYKGVSWCSRDQKWLAKICIDEQKVHLGRYSDEKIAAEVYDEIALESFGDFAVLNFPKER